MTVAEVLDDIHVKIPTKERKDFGLYAPPPRNEWFPDDKVRGRESERRGLCVRNILAFFVYCAIPRNNFIIYWGNPPKFSFT